jgi:hypothetical protein
MGEWHGHKRAPMKFGTTGLKTAAATLLISLMTANQASACILGILLCGGGGDSGGTAAPEFDGPGAVAAASLLVSIGLVLYNRARS